MATTKIVVDDKIVYAIPEEAGKRVIDHCEQYKVEKYPVPEQYKGAGVQVKS